MGTFLAVSFVLLLLHCLYVFSTRYARLHYIHQKYANRYTVSSDQAASKPTGKPRIIESYRGIRDAQRILRLASQYDFPFLFMHSLEFALFNTYAIPTISSLLLHTGQLSKSENASRRYVDTGALINAFLTFPAARFDLTDQDYDPPCSTDWESLGEDPNDPRAAIALARTNYLHSRWSSKISNNDMIYTLAIMVIQPIRWIQRYEWRTLSELEQEALFSVFCHSSRCMGIHDFPKTRSDLHEWLENYEAENMVYSDSNKQVALHTVTLLLYSVPSCLHPFATSLITTFLSERLRLAMGFESAPKWIHLFKDSLLRFRAFVVGFLMFPRSRPFSTLPIGPYAKDGVFSVEKYLSASMGVCPATGTLASEGKHCPVGESNNSTAAWRMELQSYENDPVYARAYPKYSGGWWIETIKVVFGWMNPNDKRGTVKWRAATLPSQPNGPSFELGGFRLEELGPKGLETKGREQMLAEANRLYGSRIEGIWSFTA